MNVPYRRENSCLIIGNSRFGSLFWVKLAAIISPVIVVKGGYVVDSKIAEVVTQPQILILSPCDARDAASVTISTSTASGSRRRPFSMTINYLHQTLSTGLAPSRSSRNPRAFPRTTSVRREGSSRVLTTPHKRASSRDATRPFEQLLRSFCSLPVSSVRLPLPL